MNPNAQAKRGPAIFNHHKSYRWIRQIHLWIGAWGALAAVLYGSTGLVLNHRIGENAWPQGKSSETGSSVLQIPAEARTSPEQLSLWLQRTQHLDVQSIRKGGPGGRGGERGEPRGQRGGDAPAPKWNLSGGTAADSWQLEYTPGGDQAELKRSHQSFLAAINRLHKTVGGGIGWRVLSDSFAIAMVLLGLSGIWMWARGRSYRQMLLSVFCVSSAAFLLVVIPALL
ncbi:MAG: PepSY-associated TM helix domain-containing protein [Thermomonas sp.]